MLESGNILNLTVSFLFRDFETNVTLGENLRSHQSLRVNVVYGSIDLLKSESGRTPATMHPSNRVITRFSDLTSRNPISAKSPIF